jgi:hypothetical protein
MHHHLARTSIVVAFALLALQNAGAADVAPYFESSANQKPRGNAGVSVSGDRLRLKADLALQAPNKDTEIVPRVSSAFSITERIGIETRVDLAEWNSHADLLEAKFDTRLHVRAPAPFLDELEGRVWRSPDGQSGRTLKLGFYQTLGETQPGQAVTIRSKATLETTVGNALTPASATAASQGHPETQRLGLETEIRGLLSGFLTRRSSLLLKIERVEGAEPRDARSLTYDHSWLVRDVARVGVNVGMLRTIRRAADIFEPSFRLTWRAEF